jgi:hypothetical protein
MGLGAPPAPAVPWRAPEPDARRARLSGYARQETPHHSVSLRCRPSRGRRPGGRGMRGGRPGGRRRRDPARVSAAAAAGDRSHGDVVTRSASRQPHVGPRGAFPPPQDHRRPLWPGDRHHIGRRRDCGGRARAGDHRRPPRPGRAQLEPSSACRVCARSAAAAQRERRLPVHGACRGKLQCGPGWHGEDFRRHQRAVLARPPALRDRPAAVAGHRSCALINADLGCGRADRGQCR